MSFRPSPLQIALSVAVAAAVFAPLAAQAQSNDLQYIGDTRVYSSQPTSNKTRAEVQAEAAAYNHGQVLPDGFRHLNNSVAFVGHAQTSTKTRADVLAELIEWQKNPVSHDGWRDLGSGHLVYVGVPAAKADMKMAERK